VCLSGEMGGKRGGVYIGALAGKAEVTNICRGFSHVESGFLPFLHFSRPNQNTVSIQSHRLDPIPSTQSLNSIRLFQIHYLSIHSSGQLLD
jgi:hypothetical protein